MNLVGKVHKRQRTRHLVANKLTAALTVLRQIQEGKSVGSKFISRAIQDLEAIEEWVDKNKSR